MISSVRRFCGDFLRSNMLKAVAISTRHYSDSFDSLNHPEKLEKCLKMLPTEARVVICGGGIMGSATAYHMADRGWGANTVLIEKERIGSSSPWHSSGLVGAFKPTLAQARLAQSSIELMQDLESKGRATGWKQCGSLLLARTRDRMTVYRRMKSQSVSWGIPCDLLTPQQCKELCSMLNVEDLYGGLHIPRDGVGEPHLLCLGLVREAIDKGVGVIENCEVTGVQSRDDCVYVVETTMGNIECDYFFNCAGLWASQNVP